MYAYILLLRILNFPETLKYFPVLPHLQSLSPYIVPRSSVSLNGLNECGNIEIT